MPEAPPPPRSTGLTRIDEAATLAVFEFALHHPWFDYLVTIGGLVLYEMYVLPGMAIALTYAMVFNHASSLRFHVMPHVLSYSLVGLLKNMFRRPRPGCFLPEMQESASQEGFEQQRKCGPYARPLPWAKRHGFPYLSFPSGHATVAWAVMTGLYLYLNDKKEAKWTRKEVQDMGYPISATIAAFAMVTAAWQISHAPPQPGWGWPIARNVGVMLIVAGFFWILHWNPAQIEFDDAGTPFWRTIVWVLGFSVAVLVSLHRIAKGYHHVFDSIFGMLFGAAVGLTTYSMWPEPTDRVASVAPREYGANRATAEAAAKAVLGAMGVGYLGYFFVDTLECYSESGCTMKKLKGLVH